MTDESAGFALGDFVSPLTAATTNSLLQDADPALFAATAFYQEILKTHLGARFDSEVTRLGLPSTLVGNISTLTLPYDPVPLLQKAKLEPPWLAVFRTHETVNEHTRNWYQVPSWWQLQYVLPCINAAQFAGMYPLLRAVAAVLIDRTEQGYDPTYLSGQYVWRACGMQEIAIRKIRYGALDSLTTDLFFPALQIELEVIERKMPTPGLSTVTGADNEIDIDGPGPLSAVAAAGTAPPTLTLSGTPSSMLSLRIECTTPGARGTWKYRWCADWNGTTGTFTSDITSAAGAVPLAAGVFLSIAAGNASTDNVWMADTGIFITTTETIT